MKLAASEGYEQLKPISIGVARVWAGALIAGKMLAEEAGQWQCKRGHGAPA